MLRCRIIVWHAALARPEAASLPRIHAVASAKPLLTSCRVPRPHLPSDRSPAGERGTPTYAALDLGTNNCRLLMARAAGRSGFRLGEGLAATGHLSEAAMGRTIEALRICAQRVAG